MNNDLLIFKNKISSYVICGNNETLFAALELQKYLKLAGNILLPITKETSGTAFILRKTGELDEYDTFSIETENENIIISGVNSRSVLYGVYYFLQNFCNAAFFSPNFQKIPEINELRVDKNIIINKKADIRDRFIRTEADMTPQMVDWVSKNRFNGISADPWLWDENPDVISACEERGLKTEVSGHAAYYFLKAEEYFETHPEWFPEVDGERVITKNTGDNFCYSQLDAINETAKNIINFCNKYPQMQSINFWPGDGGHVCTCSECRKQPFMELYESAVFKISECVKAALPNLKIEQLAYNFNLSDKECLNLKVIKKEKQPPVMFAFWGQNMSIPISQNSDISHKKVYSYIKEFSESSPGNASIFSYNTDTYMNSSMCPVFETGISEDFKSYKSIGIDKISLLWIPWNCFENKFDMRWLAQQNAALCGQVMFENSFDVKEYRRKYYHEGFTKEYAADIEEYWTELNEILGSLTSLTFPFAPPRFSDAWGCGFNREVFSWTLNTNYGDAGYMRLELFQKLTPRIIELNNRLKKLPVNISEESDSFITYVEHCKKRITGLNYIFQAQYAMQNSNWQSASELLEKALQTNMPDEQDRTEYWLNYCKNK